MTPSDTTAYTGMQADAPEVTATANVATTEPSVVADDVTSDVVAPDVPLADGDTIVSDSLAVDTVTPVQVEQPKTQTWTPPAFLAGIQPTPRVKAAADDPGVISLFVILFLILSITFKHSRKLFGSLWSDMWSMRRHRTHYTDRTPAESRMVAVFYIQLIVFLALLSQTYAGPMAIVGDGVGWSFNHTLALGAAWLGYYLFMLAGYRTVGYTFADKLTTSVWLRTFNATQVFAGFGLALPAALAVFVPEAARGAVTVAVVIYLAARMIFIIKGFRIFYNNFDSWLYFFLYLCALEITPLFVMYRLALYVVYGVQD